MNLTLHHLIAISSLASPLFQFTPQTQQFRLSLDRSYFSNSISNIISTSASNSYSISTMNCNFNNFLSAPINTNNDIEYTIQDQNLNITLKPADTVVTIKYCLFTNCFSMQSGGAIHLSSKCKSCTVNSCSFINCSSHRNGGGIYSESPKFWATYLCFVMCNCTANSYGANIYSQTDEGETSLIFISACQSPMNYPVPYSNGPLSLKGGNQNLNNHNYTMNYGTFLASFYSEKAKALIVRNVYVFDQIAASLIAFRQVSERHEIQKGNIINCSILHGIFRLDQVKLVVTEYYFLRNRANLTTIIVPTDENGIVFDNCVFDKPKVRKGLAQCVFQNCKFNRTHRTPIQMQMVNTWGCEGVPLMVNVIPFFRMLILLICFALVALAFAYQCTKKQKTA